MKRIAPDPIRLLDLDPKGDPARLAGLVRSALGAPAEPLPRVKWRIRSTLQRLSERRRRFLRVAVVGGVVFLTGGVVGAVVRPVLDLRPLLGIESVENIYPDHEGVRSRQHRLPAPGTTPRDEATRTLAPEMMASPTTGPLAVPEEEPPAEPATDESTAILGAVVDDLSAGLSALPSLAPSAHPPWRDHDPVPEPDTANDGTRASPTPQRQERPRVTSGLKRVAMSKLSARQPSNEMPAEPPVETAPMVPPVHTSLTPSPVGSAWLLPESRPLAPAPTAQPSRQSPASKPAAPPASEQLLLSRALRGLRVDHQPGKALAVLDEYMARYPRGALRPEATRLRTEALLALGYKQAALSELDRQPIDATEGSEENLLARGELRATQNRWREALSDFDRVVRGRLAGEPHGRVQGSARQQERLERALWDRASARSHLGDQAGARADLGECLRRFPRGHFAERAANLLGELR
jgi:hypothetical protein